MRKQLLCRLDDNGLKATANAAVTPTRDDMNLNIDPQNLQVCMKLWKEALTNTIPMATEFQIHFIQERPTILGNYERTASAWLMILRPATPADSDKDTHAALIAEIEEFQRWVKEEIAELNRLAIQTVLEDGMDELALKHPEVLARLTKYLKRNSGDRPE